MLEAITGSFMETALPRGSKRGSPAASSTHKVMGFPGDMRCQVKLVEKGFMKAQLIPAPGQPGCSIRKALNIRETIQTS